MMTDADKTFPVFEEELSAAAEYMDGVLSKMPDNLSDLSGHLRASKGKLLRAGLLIASAMCGQYERQKVLPLAAAVELLHLGSLVHDDIIDDSETRRGQPSLQKKFGKSAAVFTGDYLFTLVFSLISKYNRDRMEDVAKAVQKICLGEIMQNRFRYTYNISFADYIRIASGKTAALFAMAMYAGAKEGGLDERSCRSLGRAGGYAGLMFQIVDDCLDLSISGRKPDKPPFRDLSEGVMTLPVLFALESSPGILPVLQRAFANPSEIENAVRVVLDSGGPKRADSVAGAYYAKAHKQLGKIPDGAGKQAIILLFEKCYKRSK